jgi:hypothetical protein
LTLFGVQPFNAAIYGADCNCAKAFLYLQLVQIGVEMSTLTQDIAKHGERNGPVRFASKMQAIRAARHPDLAVGLAEYERHRRLLASLPEDKTARK